MCFRYKRFCDYCWQLVWVCVFAVCWKHRHSLRSDSSCLTQPHQDRSRNIKMIGKIDWIVKSPFIVYLPFSPLEWRHAITVETEDVHQPLHFAFSYIMDIMDPDIERLIHQVLCHLSWSLDLFLLIICRSKARSWDLHYLHQHQLHDGLQDQVGPWYVIPTFSTLVTAVRAAGLEERLSGEDPVKVFAPTKAAFALFPPEKLQVNLVNILHHLNILIFFSGTSIPAWCYVWWVSALASRPSPSQFLTAGHDDRYAQDYQMSW